MQDQRNPLSVELLNIKPWKKKHSTHKASLIQLQLNNAKEEAQGPLSLKFGHKSSKIYFMTQVSPPLQKQEGSNSDSLPDSYTSRDEYRRLRRKYLLLEDESIALQKAIREAEDEVKALDNEKIALLDQLVVLEGLIDPSEMHL
ncbi:hypothetical protein SESBI_05670 [Sesbania bispinosa]|nr:hypothetical protein SESBI_05670 [Sesbania bispinosa]